MKLSRLEISRWMEAGSKGWFEDLERALSDTFNRVIDYINAPAQAFRFTNSGALGLGAGAPVIPDLPVIDNVKGYKNGRFVANNTSAGVWQIVINCPNACAVMTQAGAYENCAAGISTVMIDLRVGGEWFEVHSAGNILAFQLIVSAHRIGNSG